MIHAGPLSLRQVRPIWVSQSYQSWKGPCLGPFQPHASVPKHAPHSGASKVVLKVQSSAQNFHPNLSLMYPAATVPLPTVSNLTPDLSPMNVLFPSLPSPIQFRKWLCCLGQIFGFVLDSYYHTPYPICWFCLQHLSRIFPLLTTCIPDSMVQATIIPYLG